MDYGKNIGINIYSLIKEWFKQITIIIYIMKIIVTGGTGFLGKRICRKLKEHNHEIMSYDIVDGYDILNTSQLKQVFDNFKPDTIIHLAACADLNIFAKKTRD
mgnify:CR=1 FL=1